MASGVIKNVLLFGFKDSITPAQQEEIIRKFTELPNSISAIKGLEWGTDAGGVATDRHVGFTHCFILTCESLEARAEYIEHPDHVAFIKELRPAVEKIVAFPFASTVTLKAPA